MTFADLDRADRQVLMDWLATAKSNGVDAVIDFADRPWESGELDAVIGVFETGHPLASWLLVRYQAQWVAVTIEDEAISAVCDNLAEALGHIPMRAPP
jgi:type II secretory pathway component PulL